MTKQDLEHLLGIAGALLLIVAVAAAGSVNGVRVGSVPVFAVCAMLAVLIQWVVFVPSYRLQTEHYFDLTGSLTYITLLVCALLLTEANTRSVLIASLVLIWALRLGTFLFVRVRADGADKRFTRMKTIFLQFLMTWTIQGAWVLVTLAAGLAAITADVVEPLGAGALLGTSLWLLGFVIEVVADYQKRAFRQDPQRTHEFITSGLWAWSRHPNYFGEILLWFGIALIALPVLSGWQLLTLVSPVFVVVLLTKISGIPMLERRANRKWGEDPDYQDYKRRTPVLIMRPPTAG